MILGKILKENSRQLKLAQPVPEARIQPPLKLSGEEVGVEVLTFLLISFSFLHIF